MNVMRIYVGNLNYRTTEEGLAELFGEFGEVANSTVVTDRQTGRSRGFGFVEMKNDEETRKAIKKINGHEFEEQTLTINEARPRTEGRGGGGGRDRGQNW